MDCWSVAVSEVMSGRLGQEVVAFDEGALQRRVIQVDPAVDHRDDARAGAEVAVRVVIPEDRRGRLLLEPGPDRRAVERERRRIRQPGGGGRQHRRRHVA